MDVDKAYEVLRRIGPAYYPAAIGMISAIARDRLATPIAKVRDINAVLDALDGLTNGEG